MALTYEPIARVTVGSGGSNTIDFTNIPTRFTDLVLVASVRTDESTSGHYRYHRLYINNSTNNMSWRDVYSDGPIGSQNDTVSYFYAPSATAVASAFSSNQWYLTNYTSSNNKSISNQNAVVSNSLSNTNWIMDFSATIWSQTTAINQLTLVAYGSTNFVQHSTATLYGIKNTV